MWISRFWKFVFFLKIVEPWKQDEKRISDAQTESSEGSSEAITSTEGLLDKKVEKEEVEFHGRQNLPRQTWNRKVSADLLLYCDIF